MFMVKVGSCTDKAYRSKIPIRSLREHVHEKERVARCLSILSFNCLAWSSFMAHQCQPRPMASF